MLASDGDLSWEPYHDRRSLFCPGTPPVCPVAGRRVRAVDPRSLLNALLATVLVCRNYVVEAVHVDRLRAAPSISGFRATRARGSRLSSRNGASVEASRREEVMCGRGRPVEVHIRHGWWMAETVLVSSKTLPAPSSPLLSLG
jgi:hypothetical protein